jgi:hypothetical protein
VAEQDAALQILQFVALALPAVGVFYRFILEQELSKASNEIEVISQQSKRSIGLFFTVALLSAAGVLSCIVLYLNYDSFFISGAVMAIAVALVAVTRLTYGWLYANLEKMDRIAQEQKETALEAKNKLESIRESATSLNVNSMSYQEMIKYRKQYYELFDELDSFEYSKDDDFTELISDFQDHCSENISELEDLIEAINNSPELAPPFEIKKRARELLKSPIKLVKVIVVNGLLIISFAIPFGAIEATANGVKLTAMEWIIILVATVAFATLWYVLDRSDWV